MNSVSFKRIICLFRNDLRILDNPVLTEAVRRARNLGVPLMNVVVIDNTPNSNNATWPQNVNTPEDATRGRDGQPMLRIGAHRAQFLVESVLALRDSLRAAGSDLTVCVGAPGDVVPRLVAANNNDADAASTVTSTPAPALVLYERAVASEERAAEDAMVAALARTGSQAIGMWGAQTLYAPDDLPFDVPAKVPSGFTTMRKKIEQARVAVRAPLPAPSLEGLGGGADPETDAAEDGKEGEPTAASLLAALGFATPPTTDAAAALAWRGGAAAAHTRLEAFCVDGLATYKTTRNGSIGASYSTKLSPWLALGCVTARQVHARVRRYEDAHGGQTVHTYWVAFELMWRDYFRFWCLREGDAVWRPYGPRGAPAPHPGSAGSGAWAEGAEAARRFDAWRRGRTGVPFVDGHMRELARTGFMSNRGRQNVASFLVHDLRVDWRLGAAHFEERLLDYDPCANVGNWLSLAGLTGSGRVSVFNVAKQAAQYDRDAAHARLWCAELRGVKPPARVHALPFVSAGERGALAPGYPAPVVTPPARWRHHASPGGAGAQQQQRGNGGGGGRRKQRPRKNKNRAHRGRGGKVFNTR